MTNLREHKYAENRQRMAAAIETFIKGNRPLLVALATTPLWTPCGKCVCCLAGYSAMCLSPEPR